MLTEKDPKCSRSNLIHYQRAVLKCFSHVISLKPYNSLISGYYCWSHFTEGETEARWVKYFIHIYIASSFNQFGCYEDRSKISREVRTHVIYLWGISSWGNKVSIFPLKMHGSKHRCINTLLNKPEKSSLHESAQSY